jgi:hypothetical protein
MIRDVVGFLKLAVEVKRQLEESQAAIAELRGEQRAMDRRLVRLETIVEMATGAPPRPLPRLEDQS